MTGDANTRWGAERIKDGHPAPFKLSYVEIGNEDWFDKSGTYGDRYAQYYKAIKARYPDLQLIATTPITNAASASAATGAANPRAARKSRHGNDHSR